MKKNYEMLKRIEQLREQTKHLNEERWLDYSLFTWNWWLLCFFLFISIIIWILLVDRKRMIEILLFGMIITFITIYMDSIGKELGFWVYPIELSPFGHRAIAFDAGMVAVAFMLIYQYFDRWKSFIIALIGMALIFAFIGEPFAHWAELVLYIKWKYIYSFIYYILVGILVRWILIKLLKVSNKA
ncbi:CBO0543 family protein [Aquibacillus kalidii]|uniref:CBO0543 family protein n=1 Tax=Aquibacillus kalidii TaxID=2762597 RepID=UPI001645444D|nr:CBO0543 family protein [Aquibacillus kalidii]